MTKTYFEKYPNRNLQLRAWRNGDPQPLFGDFLPARLRGAGGNIERMKTAVVESRAGAVLLLYVPQAVPLDDTWTDIEIAEFVTDPPVPTELSRHRGFDHGWLQTINCPTA